MLGQLSGITFQDNDLQDLTHPHPLIDHPASGSVAALDSSGNRCHSSLLSSNHWTKVGTTMYALSYWKTLVGDPTSSAQQVEYADPDRSPASYNALLGGTATLGAFLAQARLQSAADWKPEYTAVHVNAYLRAGFEPAH